MVGTDLVLASVPVGGSRAGAGRVGEPGVRASWGLRPPATRGRAWVPAGSGLDLVPCSGLSVSLALLGKVWVLGLGRGAACGGRTCPGRAVLRPASGSTEVAGGQATKGSSGGGGGKTNFLTGYRAAPRAGGRAHGPPRAKWPQRMPRPPRMHTQHPGTPRQDQRGQAGGGGSVRHKRKEHTRKQTKQNKKRAVSEGSRSPQSSSCHHAGGPSSRRGWGPTEPPPTRAHAGGGAGAGSLTRGLLSGLVERPEEAPLMDLDLGTQVQRAAQTRKGPPALGFSLPSGGPSRRPGALVESPEAAPVCSTPGRAWGCPAVPTPPLTRPRRAPRPLGAPSEPQWCSWRPWDSFSPTQKVPCVQGPRPQLQDGTEEPSARISRARGERTQGFP